MVKTLLALEALTQQMPCWTSLKSHTLALRRIRGYLIARLNASRCRSTHGGDTGVVWTPSATMCNNTLRSDQPRKGTWCWQAVTLAISFLAARNYRLVLSKSITTSLCSQRKLVTFEVMSTSSPQFLPWLSPCVSVDPVAAGSNNSDASDTRTITIVFGIIGAVLTLFTIAIATLQYRLQTQRRVDVRADDDDTEMRPECSTHKQGALTASPS
jgi:hypothetical protein